MSKSDAHSSMPADKAADSLDLQHAMVFPAQNHQPCLLESAFGMDLLLAWIYFWHDNNEWLVLLRSITEVAVSQYTVLSVTLLTSRHLGPVPQAVAHSTIRHWNINFQLLTRSDTQLSESQSEWALLCCVHR